METIITKIYLRQAIFNLSPKILIGIDFNSIILVTRSEIIYC